MKHKKYKLRFIRNVIVCVIALFIVARLLDVMPGFKRDKTEGITNLVIGDEDITEELKHNIFVDDNETVYISYEDTKNLFDNTIIYDYATGQLITTSDTKVGDMLLNQKHVTINGTVIDTLGTLIEKDNQIYIPISDIKLVYNIDVNYIKETDVVTIDKLDKQLTRATVVKNIKVKSKMRGFSKTLAKLTQGEQISYFEGEYRGWIKIRTNSGIVGYIKDSLVTNKCIIRQNMNEKKQASNIKNDELNGWLNINDNIFENEALSNYSSRTVTVDSIINMVLSENAKGISISIKSYSQELKMFLKELSPRLREIGVPVAVNLSDKDKTDEIKDIVDYIVE